MSSRPLATFLLRCFWGGELHTQQMFSHIIVVDMFQAADCRRSPAILQSVLS